MIQVYTLRVQKLSFINYCYVVSDQLTRHAVLIDPAWQPEIIEQLISQKNLIPLAVLLTHYHSDHVDLASYFAERYAIPVYMNQAEVEFYRFSCSGLLPVVADQGLTLGSLLVSIIQTPGHTYGGVCYWIGDHLFTGDTVFNEGCGICLGKGADPYKMFESLQRLKELIAPHTRIYPGHCYGISVGQPFEEVHKYNIYLQFTDVENFVAFRMRGMKQSWFNFQ